MHDQQPPNPETPTTEVVVPGPVTGGATAATGANPFGATGALARPVPAQARWARIGLAGIGAAALIAVAALAFGSTVTPTGTLAAGSTTTGATDTSGVNELHGGPGLRGGRGGPGFGGITITAISGSDISLATDDGWTRTITVDDGTTFTKAGEDIALGDLAVGDTVGFRQTLEDDGSWTIDALAVILPHVGGEVTAVDGSTITVELRGGTSETINIGSETNIVVNGDAAALADIEVGMLLVAEGTENADGSLDATRVKAGDRGLRGPDDGFGGRGFHGPGFGGGDAGPDATAAPEATGAAS